MTPEELAEALIEWVKETIPELQEPSVRAGAEPGWPLPDVAVGIAKTIQRQIGQQRELVERVHSCRIYLAVDPEPSDSAERQLYNFAHVLMDELVRDRTLAGRVSEAASAAEVDYEPLHAELEGGGTARVGTFSLVVTEPVAL